MDSQFEVAAECGKLSLASVARCTGNGIVYDSGDMHVAASSAFSPTPTENIQLAWLVRLRWLALAGQLLVVAGIEGLLGIALPWGPLAAVLGAEAASNVLCRWAATHWRVTERWLVAVLALDVLLLTALLHMTGGPVNPFSFLYLVHIVLAAVTLQQAAAWALAGLGLLAFGLLFVLPPWPGATVHAHAGHADHLWLHLQGMYVAFAVSAAFVVYFVQRIRQALTEREHELAAARDLAARQAKFAALATMAAGAAHELGTPLSTIAVAAGELEKALAGCAPGALPDVRLIREQVRRCQGILQQLSVEAGQGMGEGVENVPVAELAERLRSRELGGKVKVQVEVSPLLRDRKIAVVRQAFVRAVENLVQNAVQASPDGSTVMVRCGEKNGALVVEVEDHGKGMSPQVLARAGEPFFTTKEPGQGIGLGLFLARTMIEQMGGQLDISSAEGRGTTATLVLPWDGATKHHVATDSRRATLNQFHSEDAADDSRRT